MPTYEYRCPNGHEFEMFQRMSDPPMSVCPECGKDAERVLSGGAGLLFKGGGFYITDYRSESYKKAAEKDKAGGSSDGSPGGSSAGSSGAGGAGGAAGSAESGSGSKAKDKGGSGNSE